jgi:hypothetical protein
MQFLYRANGEKPMTNSTSTISKQAKHVLHSKIIKQSMLQGDWNE